MKLPDSFTKVTLLSRILAMLLFVSLPFIGFYFGQKNKFCDLCPTAVLPKSNPVLTPTPVITPGEVTVVKGVNNNWGTYQNNRGVEFRFPPIYEIGYTGTNINNEDFFDISLPPQEEMMPGTGYDFYISYHPDQKSLVEYVASQVSLIKIQNQNDPRFKIVNEKIVKYGSNTVYQFTIESYLGSLDDETFFFKDGVGLHISETGVIPSEHTQLMNSVKFTK